MTNVNINRKHDDMYDQGEPVVNIGFSIFINLDNNEIIVNSKDLI